MYGLAKYGQVRFGENSASEEEISLLAPDLMRYLPKYYSREIGLVKSIEESYALEIARILYRIKDLNLQLNVETATWGLDFYERDLGLTTDYTRPLEFRRERIIAKLRSRGTTTLAMVKAVAESFSGSEVKIIEHNEIYTFTIKFVGLYGIPPNMAGLIEAIEEIKPAHLLYNFEYSFTTWGMVSKLTWNQARTKTWDELREYS